MNVWDIARQNRVIRPVINREGRGQYFDEPGQMLLIKNDPKYNEQWPRPLVPYKRIYGIDEPRTSSLNCTAVATLLTF